jgi:hypothetical protein
MTVKQLCETMDCVEFHQWGIHFARKAKAESDAVEKAKAKQRRR